MEIKIVGNAVCSVTIEYCDLGHEHEEVIALKHGPITLAAYRQSKMIANIYSPIIEEQLKAHQLLSKTIGWAFDKEFKDQK